MIYVAITLGVLLIGAIGLIAVIGGAAKDVTLRETESLRKDREK